MCGTGEFRYIRSSNSRDGRFRDAVRAGIGSLGDILRQRIAGTALARSGSGASMMFTTATALDMPSPPQTLAMGRKTYNSHKMSGVRVVPDPDELLYAIEAAIARARDMRLTEGTE